MNVENLAGNQYVNFALVASTELPSVFVGEFLINRYGRRWCHVPEKRGGGVRDRGGGTWLVTAGHRPCRVPERAGE